MSEPKAYAQVWTDGGGDPTFDELDGYLLAHFNARAVHVDDSAIERLAREHFESRRHFFEGEGDLCLTCGEDPDQDYLRVTMHFTDGDG